MCTGSARGFIVVGVDDRVESLNAAKYAIEHARVFGLCVRLVHAYGSAVGYGQYGALNLGRVERTAHALIGTVLAQLEVPDGVCVERVVDNGSAVDALTTAGGDARFVVIGRRDKYGAPQLLRRHVASRLSARAPVPVLTVPASWQFQERSDRPVIIGLDAVTPSRRPLAFAFSHADQIGAPLRVVHAVPDGRGTSDDHAAISQALTRLRARYPDVAVDVQIARGDAEEVLAQSSTDASLLVVGKPYEYPGLGAWRSSLTGAVLRRASCPVAVVPQAVADTRGALAHAGDTASPLDASARS